MLGESVPTRLIFLETRYFAAAVERPGFNIKLRSKRKAKVGKHHRITKNDAIKFLTEEFGVEVV